MRSVPEYLQGLKNRAAEKAQAAMLTLAEHYHKGRCLTRDRAKARVLYEDLAKLGHPEAIAHDHPTARQFLDDLNEMGFDDC